MRKSWSLRGQQAQILLSGYNARRVIFGGLELSTGERLFVTRRRQQASDFAQWLLRLRQNHSEDELAVLLDENSCHTCAATRKLAQRLNVRLIFLPKRSPHLNPADHLWRWAKGTLCANRQDPDLSAQAERFVLDLRGLPSQTALRLAGVLSKRFWLRRVLSKLF